MKLTQATTHFEDLNHYDIQMRLNWQLKAECRVQYPATNKINIINLQIFKINLFNLYIL